MHVARPPLERVLAKVIERPDGCWEFTGAKSERGYGMVRVRVNGQPLTRRAHRVVYEALVGPIPDGLTLDHLCHVCACVNPAHLEPVTRAENTRRQRAHQRLTRGTMTHCPSGHPYDEQNMYMEPSGARRCRACWRAYAKRNYYARKAA